MKTAKKFAAALLITCLVPGLSGCGAGNLKDNILDGYNQWLQFSSKHALTKENKLQGEKRKGIHSGSLELEVSDRMYNT